MAKTRRDVSLSIALVLLLAATGSAYGQSGSLDRRIDAIVDSDEFRSAFWGIEVVDLSSGEVLYERNARRAFVPASTTKLATTAAALDLLGPERRLTTTLFARGVIRNDTLHGHLVVRGDGDPTIAESLGTYGRPGVLTAWVDSVRHVGIRHITGDVIGDDDAFDDVPFGPGWQWDDLPFYYAPEISALSYNENVVQITLTGRRPGLRPILEYAPVTSYVSMDNAAISVNANGHIEEDYRRSAEGNSFVLASRVPENRVEREALSVYNPTRYFAHVLLDQLRDGGISVRGTSMDVDDLPGPVDYERDPLIILATHPSPSIAELAALANKPSHNLTAEALHKTLGRADSLGAFVRPGSWTTGAHRVNETLARAGIDTMEVRLVDGSGLSRHNLFSPRAFSRLLEYMWTHPHDSTRDAFVTSLAIGGQDGTLRSRFTAGPAAGRVWARTGTMTSVSALVGYLSRPNGDPVSFVILCNNYLVEGRRIRQAQDEIVNLVARLSL